MKYVLAKKVGFLLLSVVCAMIALSFVEDLIFDRLHYQEEAKESISNSWSGQQQIIGPILVVPYSYVKEETRWDKEAKIYVTKLVEYNGVQYTIPEQMQVDANLVTQERSRGIFSFPVYTADVRFRGEFALSSYQTLEKLIEEYGDSVEIFTPYMSVSVRDIRGINNKPQLAWQGATHNFEAGSKLDFSPQGIHVSLPKLFQNLQRLSIDESEATSFDFSLNIRGMEALWFTPVGKETSVELKAAWPHPKFSGEFLPNAYTVGAETFQAQWKVSEFSTDIIRDVEASRRGSRDALRDNRFGVYLDTPVDIYRQSFRSVKYGLLFVGLTFISFFIFEILKKLRIHPVQYTLISFSLAIFYLLLLALSESLGFMLAYIGATFACVSLLTLYVCSILRNIRWGLAFGGFVATLYGLLYIILSSEDHALLLGASLVFVMLGLVMFTTRHVDWYQVGNFVQSTIQKDVPEAEQDQEQTVEAEQDQEQTVEAEQIPEAEEEQGAACEPQQSNERKN